MVSQGIVRQLLTETLGSLNKGHLSDRHTHGERCLQKSGDQDHQKVRFICHLKTQGNAMNISYSYEQCSTRTHTHTSKSEPVASLILSYLGPLVLSGDLVNVKEVRGGPLQEIRLKLVTGVIDDHDGARPDQRRGGGVVYGEHSSILGGGGRRTGKNTSGYQYESITLVYKRQNAYRDRKQRAN